MTFAVPLFLLAALAATIPLLLHLIHRKQAREVPFPTLRFLRLSVQRTRRRKYLDDLLLMLLRMAVLALIAFGLARPAITSLKMFLGRGATRSVVIVLDNSASMGMTDDGTPRFETARHAAEQILSGLHEGDSAALLPTCGPPAPQQGQLLSTLDTVLQALTAAQVSFERADLSARLQQARQLLAADVKSPNKEIFLITDNQELSWEGSKEPPAKEKTSGQEVPVVLVSVNKAPELNVALRDVRLSSPAPVAGMPVRATVEVANTSAVPLRKHVELDLDGSRVSVSPDLNLPPGNSVQYDFHFTPEGSGVHRGAIRVVEEDGLPLDNTQFFALSIDQQIPILILKPRQGEIAYTEDSFYLENALAPDGAESGAFRIVTRTPEELDREQLGDFAVIFAVNLPAPDATVAGKLAEYVRGGGHLFWICGRNVQPDAYNAMNAQSNNQLLPASLAELRQPVPDGPESWRIAFLDRDYPSLTPLTEPASLYSSVLIYKYFPLEWDIQSGGRVLARAEDGSVLLAEKRVGAGSVLLLGTGVHIEWTNLPLKPIFLPLIARLVFHLAGAETERAQMLAGSPVGIPLGEGVSEPSKIEVVRPSGEILRIRQKPSDGKTFRYADTHEAGVYLLRVLNARPGKPLAFAANVDPAESDPATVTRDELQHRFGQQPVLYCDTPDELGATIHRLREGRSLWEPFLALVLIGLVFEVFLANRARGLPTAAPMPVSGRPAVSSIRSGDVVSPDEVAEFLKQL